MVTMGKRETVLLAHNYKPGQDYNGWYLSEKLDGLRCIFDGGWTRGLKCVDIPFCNSAKHDRYNRELRSTGLWTRYLQPIQAPDQWIDRLPKGIPLDGELWLGYNRFQETCSITKRLDPDPDQWNSVQYKVFDIPTMSSMLGDGDIKITIGNNTTKIRLKDCDKWFFDLIPEILPGNYSRRPSVYCFDDVVDWLTKNLPMSNTLSMVNQYVVQSVKNNNGELVDPLGLKVIDSYLREIVEEKGGEGVMLRHPKSKWKPERSYDLLKYKPYEDSEGICIGYVWGRETDKGSKLLGLMGNMIIRWGKVQFELSGFSDLERTMSIRDINHPGEIVDSRISNLVFPRGSIVPFRYRGLTDSGKPREARYLRKL